MSYSPDFVISCESKLKRVNKKIIKSLWPTNNINWVAKSSNDNSSGILILWDDLRHALSSHLEGAYSISANFISKGISPLKAHENWDIPIHFRVFNSYSLNYYMILHERPKLLIIFTKVLNELLYYKNVGPKLHVCSFYII